MVSSRNIVNVRSDFCIFLPRRYLGKEEPPVVRESCVVALDMADYGNSEEFQYANTLSAGARGANS